MPARSKSIFAPLALALCASVASATTFVNVDERTLTHSADAIVAGTVAAIETVDTGDGRIDDNLTVSDGDVYLVPRGYHGPCVAAPGYTMYYLNVLAGDRRSMAATDDAPYRWVREQWQRSESVK